MAAMSASASSSVSPDTTPVTCQGRDHTSSNVEQELIKQKSIQQLRARQQLGAIIAPHCSAPIAQHAVPASRV